MRVTGFLPCPPLLVTDLVGEAAGAVAPLLTACEQVVAEVVRGAAGASTVVVGAGTRTVEHAPGAWGSLAGFGVPVEAPAAHPAVPATLPPSLTVAAWLLDQVRGAAPVPVRWVEVAAGAPPAECLALGAGLATGDVGAWLVMADGSARRSTKGPGYLDPRAEPFDLEVARALADGDGAGLAGLDPDLATDLLVAGRPAWQVLAGAARRAGPPRTSRLHRHEAPFGVGYLVATWTW